MDHFITKLLPFSLAMLVFVFLIIFDAKISIYLEPYNIDWSNLYSAVFDWAAIQTGFLFGVYGFIVGSPTEFIKAIEGTKPLKNFKSGIATSLFAGFVLTSISLPLLILSPNPFGMEIISRTIVKLWFAIFVFALGTFFISAYLFAFMSRQKPAHGVNG